MLQARTPVAIALATLLLAFPVSAAVSPQYREWRNGPVQWIMTAPEKKAWSRISTDEAAEQFVNLFWARRDPTPGTPQNEARDEHDARVKYADEKFREQRQRGSLTDRGRVWVVLGRPPSYSEMLGRKTGVSEGNVAAPAAATKGSSQEVPSTGAPSGSRQLGERTIWVWEHADATATFGLPRVEIVFVTDPITKRAMRDLFRGDYSAAEAVTLKKQIRGDYEELPEWAAIGGLTPRARVTLAMPATPPQSPAQASVSAPAPAAPAPAASAPVAAAPRGATRLTLTRNAFAVDPRQSGDPFAKVEAVDRFKSTDDLGWVAQYCGQADGHLSVPFMVHIAGGPADQPVDLATPRDEVVPDRIPSSPGCHMLRGAIPLESFAAGKYTLRLLVDDPIVTSDSYELSRDFIVE